MKKLFFNADYLPNDENCIIIIAPRNAGRMQYIIDILNDARAILEEESNKSASQLATIADIESSYPKSFLIDGCPSILLKPDALIELRNKLPEYTYNYEPRGNCYVVKTANPVPCIIKKLIRQEIIETEKLANRHICSEDFAFIKGVFNSLLGI